MILVIHIWISVWIIQATEKYSAAMYYIAPGQVQLRCNVAEVKFDKNLARDGSSEDQINHKDNKWALAPSPSYILESISIRESDHADLGTQCQSYVMEDHF